MKTSPLSSAEVITLANAELGDAARLYSQSRYLQISTFALGTVSIFISNAYTYIPALLALGTQLASWRVRHEAARRHEVGEEGRMRGLLLDAFGPTNERIELTNWLDCLSARTWRKAKSSPVDTDYFASTSSYGIQRLRDHLQENAFWGKCLYKATAAYYGRGLAIISVIIVFSILAAIPLASNSQGLLLARILVAILASGAVATQVSEIISWRSAEAKIDALDRRLDVLASYSDSDLRSQHIDVILSVYGDYCVASAAASPIPSWIYWRERERLNDLWKQRLAQAVQPQQ